MKIQINGEPRDFADLKTLSDIAPALGLEPSMILIEHNGQATRRADWSKTPVAGNDRVEILQVAAGGLFFPKIHFNPAETVLENRA